MKKKQGYLHGCHSYIYTKTNSTYAPYHKSPRHFPGANKPEVVAENPPLGERLAATPAIADNTLYVRTAGHLYAFAANK
jgi:hypothetical protein